ncbi:MAG: fibronectin type III domain-containing protein, partial [Planctomycetota bacterium]
MLFHPGTATAPCAALALGLLFTSCAEAGAPGASAGASGGASAEGVSTEAPAAVVPQQRGGDVGGEPLPIEQPRPVRDTSFVEVEVAPNVVDLQPTSARFSWITREPSIGSLALTGPSGTNETEEAAGPRRHHVLDVRDLAPLTTYAYTIDGRFSGTIVTPGVDEPFTFAVFGHPGGTTAPHTYPADVAGAQQESRIEGLERTNERASGVGVGS